MFKKLLGIDVLETRLNTLESEKAAMADALALEKAERELAELKRAELAAQNEALQKELETKAKTPKEIATEKGEPWVAVIDTGFADPKNPSTGFFELDWNKAFVEQLTEAGYSGRTDEDVIDMWFNDICRGVYDVPPT